MNLSIRKNTFWNLDKYIWQFGQIWGPQACGRAILDQNRRKTLWFFSTCPTPPNGYVTVMMGYWVISMSHSWDRWWGWQSSKTSWAKLVFFVKSKICSPILCFYQQKYVDFRSLQIEYHFHVIEFKWWASSYAWEA